MVMNSGVWEMESAAAVAWETRKTPSRAEARLQISLRKRL